MSGLACTRKVTEDEDATELRLGPDFNDASCLSMAEVRLIQQSKVDDDAESGVETSTTQTRCARFRVKGF
jgi:DNA-directed RNA polymerase II subunit RPB4